MLDFYFIRDAQSNSASTKQLSYASGIGNEEFETAQQAGIIEMHADYYGKFRWSSHQVQQKRLLLMPAVADAIPNLASILKQAFAAECGLAAFGD